MVTEFYNWYRLLYWLSDYFLESSEKGTKFIEDGVRELLKARRVLCGSYVYGYYLEDDGYNKSIFEFMQVSKYVYYNDKHPSTFL